MLPTIYNDSFPSIWKDFDRLFDMNLTKTNGHTYMVPIDLIETDKEYKLIMDLPGINKEDVDLSFEKDRLTISLKQDRERNEENGNYVMKQRKRMGFYLRE